MNDARIGAPEAGCLLVVDARERVIGADAKAAELFERPLDALFGASVHDLVTAADGGPLHLFDGAATRGHVAACVPGGSSAARQVDLFHALLRMADDTVLRLVSVDLLVTDGDARRAPADGAGRDGADGRSAVSSNRSGELEDSLVEVLTIVQRALGTDAAAAPPYRPAEFELLSARERQIVRLLLRNRRVPSIARELYLSPSTVRNHLSSVFRKFGVSNQSELLERFRAPETPGVDGSGGSGSSDGSAGSERSGHLRDET